MTPRRKPWHERVWGLDYVLGMWGLFRGAGVWTILGVVLTGVLIPGLFRLADKASGMVVESTGNGFLGLGAFVVVLFSPAMLGGAIMKIVEHLHPPDPEKERIRRERQQAIRAEQEERRAALKAEMDVLRDERRARCPSTYEALGDVEEVPGVRVGPRTPVGLHMLWDAMDKDRMTPLGVVGELESGKWGYWSWDFGAGYLYGPPIEVGRTRYWAIVRGMEKERELRSAGVI